eukprot:COSAG05_NODE_2398_length_3113_cov_2.751493_1_plen_404_part_10
MEPDQPQADRRAALRHATVEHHRLLSRRMREQLAAAERVSQLSNQLDNIRRQHRSGSSTSDMDRAEAELLKAQGELSDIQSQVELLRAKKVSVLREATSFVSSLPLPIDALSEITTAEGNDAEANAPVADGSGPCGRSHSTPVRSQQQARAAASSADRHAQRIMNETNSLVHEGIQADMHAYLLECAPAAATIEEWAKQSVWSRDTGGARDENGAPLRVRDGHWKRLWIAAQDNAASGMKPGSPTTVGHPSAVAADRLGPPQHRKDGEITTAPASVEPAAAAARSLLRRLWQLGDEKKAAPATVAMAAPPTISVAPRTSDGTATESCSGGGAKSVILSDVHQHQQLQPPSSPPPPSPQQQQELEDVFDGPKRWLQLRPEQQAAAAALGWAPESWDAGELSTLCA